MLGLKSFDVTASSQCHQEWQLPCLPANLCSQSKSCSNRATHCWKENPALGWEKRVVPTQETSAHGPPRFWVDRIGFSSWVQTSMIIFFTCIVSFMTMKQIINKKRPCGNISAFLSQEGHFPVFLNLKVYQCVNLKIISSRWNHVGVELLGNYWKQLLLLRELWFLRKSFYLFIWKWQSLI